MRLTGTPLRLRGYPAECRTNAQFRGVDLSAFERVFLPPALDGLVDRPPAETREFIEDDNRGAILPEPAATLDGLEFFLSVKGVGSTVEPFGFEPLDRAAAARAARDPAVRERLLRGTSPDGTDRVITGELWLRGSPYGGQGLPHAEAALRVSERADLTSLAGFRIAPVVKIGLLPAELEERLREIYWYRRYPGRFVQEIRLVPSNVRVYFHSRTTLGTSPRHVFDLFGVDSDARALRFEVGFVRSGLAMLTLFARTLERRPEGAGFSGLDFHDVWLDKDAVLAPDGTAFFVDLEGIEPVAVGPAEVVEKIEDQVYRSLYEFMFAFEAIETERRRRFGATGDRRAHFAEIVLEALRDDPVARPRSLPRGLDLEIRNPLGEESVYTRFPLVDR